MVQAMTDFKPGDRVLVTDPALAQLRAIMASSGEVDDVLPNHHGTVADDADTGNGTVLINFDGGGCAPYPVEECRHLDPDMEHPTYRRACSDGDCDLGHGHDGPHTAWVPE